MALEMRAVCEKCKKELHKSSLAYICTHECTFCHECTEEMNFVCPNCQGELVKRPRSGEITLSCSLSAESNIERQKSEKRENMIKITVVITQPKEKEAFDSYYFGVHVPIIKSLPEVKEVTVTRVFESQFQGVNPYLIAEFRFDDKQKMDAALNSVDGQRLYSDVPQLMRFLEKEPIIMFGDVLKITGENDLTVWD